MTTQLALISEIERAIANGSAERRGAMVLQIADLFIAGAINFSDDEIRLFDDVISRLAAEIEVSARALLAQRLAPVARAPINVIRRLAGDDEIRVAEPILVQSEQLDDAALVATAKTKSQAHLLAISRRNTLSEAVTDILVERGSQPVVLNTAKNAGARFSQLGFARLVKRADDDDLLAACVGSRPDIPRPLFLALLDKASERVRAKLIAAHPYAGNEVDRAVNEVTSKLRGEVATDLSNYAAAQAAVQSLRESGQLSDAAIKALADKGGFQEAVVSLAYLCDVPFEIVEQSFVQDQSETLLILAKAARLSWSTTKALLTLRAKQRSLPPGRVEQGLAAFDRLSIETAQQILKFYKIRRGPSPHDARSPRDATTKKSAAAAIEHRFVDMDR